MSASSAPGHRQGVDFDIASVMVEQRELRGDHNLLASQVNQSIQNLTGTQQAMQGEVRRIADQQAESNALLHRMEERSTGFERVFAALDAGGLSHATEITALRLALAEWKGLVKGVGACILFGVSAATAFAVYRFDTMDAAIKELQQDFRANHEVPR